MEFKHNMDFLTQKLRMESQWADEEDATRPTDVETPPSRETSATPPPSESVQAPSSAFAEGVSPQLLSGEDVLTLNIVVNGDNQVESVASEVQTEYRVVDDASEQQVGENRAKTEAMASGQTYMGFFNPHGISFLGQAPPGAHNAYVQNPAYMASANPAYLPQYPAQAVQQQANYDNRAVSFQAQHLPPTAREVKLPIAANYNNHPRPQVTVSTL